MSLIEDQIRHEFYLQRLATQLINENIVPSYREAYLAARRILVEYDSLSSVTQVSKIAASVRAATAEHTDKAWAGVTAGLDEMAAYEAAFYAKAVGAYGGARLAVPAKDKIASYINRSMMSLAGNPPKTGLWSDFVAANRSAFTATVDNVIKAAYVNGRTINQAMGDIKAVSEGLLKNQAEALIRTGTQHYAIQAREAMAAENSDIIKKRYFLAVLDNRTTTTCMGYASSDKNPWDYDDPKAPELPAHYNCRSSWLFLLEGQEAPTGMRTAVGGRDTPEAEEKYYARRSRTDKVIKRRGRKDDGMFDPSQVRASTRPEQFLRSQPRWFVEDSLGKTRARLFLDGKLPIESFTDAQGRPLNLDQLRARDAEAFKRAGL